ncbi:MAG: response regulator [Betaproteobacteria bacterium]|nr:response regulator [Betaproteobacteria bacterium]
MLQILVNANYDFVGKRRWFYLASGGLMLLSLIWIFFVGGLNYGIDFTGGALVQVRYDKPASVDLVRRGLDEIKLGNAVIQQFGDVQEYLIRLAQVIANLLTNAAKYTDNGGQISVSAAREGEEIVVRIRDTGVGISPELQSRIFELFVQGDRSLDRSQGGLGIGLTLVQRLVEMHGGSVAVFSRGTGKGSEFTARFPALPEPRGHQDPALSGVRGPAGDAPGKRILVVDDNVDACESIAMILRASGYHVRCVYDGSSVLKVATGYRPDVVVLDIGLPGMSGYEVARQLRQLDEFRRTLFIAVTGYGQEDDRRRSQEAGFDHHLTKPIDPDDLQAIVARPFPPP